MKIPIAGDGSESAAVALDDLLRAGMPRQTEARDRTMAEELIPAPASLGGVETTCCRGCGGSWLIKRQTNS